MGAVIDFDARNTILRVTVEGQLTDAILLGAYASVARYVASHGPCRAIVNISGVTKLEVSRKAVRELAQSSPAIPTGYMRVIVAPLDSMYGMARTFQILSELTRPDLRVVRTMDDAYRLLRVESPEFGPVSCFNEFLIFL